MVSNYVSLAVVMSAVALIAVTAHDYAANTANALDKANTRLAQCEQRVSQMESSMAALGASNRLVRLETAMTTMESFGGVMSTNLIRLTDAHVNLVKSAQSGLDRYALELIIVERALIDRFGDSKWKASYDKAKADVATKP